MPGQSLRSFVANKTSCQTIILHLTALRTICLAVAILLSGALVGIAQGLAQPPRTMTPQEATEAVYRDTQESFQRVVMAFDEVIDRVAKTTKDPDAVANVTAQKDAFLHHTQFDENSTSIYGTTDVSPLYEALREHRKQCYVAASKYMPSVQQYIATVTNEKDSTLAELELKAFEQFKSDNQQCLYFTIAEGQNYVGNDSHDSKLSLLGYKHLYGRLNVTVEKVRGKNVELTVSLTAGTGGRPPYISKLKCRIADCNSLAIESTEGPVVSYGDSIQWTDNAMLFETSGNFSSSFGRYLGINTYKAAVFKANLISGSARE